MPPIPRIVIEKKKPEPRGFGSRELHNLSSYKMMISSLTLEVNVTERCSCETPFNAPFPRVM
jgi:hypothetical protein